MNSALAAGAWVFTSEVGKYKPYPMASAEGLPEGLRKTIPANIPDGLGPKYPVSPSTPGQQRP